jgi:PAS domain S-box-containing protein
LILAEDARRRIDVLLRSVPDGLIVTNAQGHIQMINTPAEKLFGDYSKKTVRDLAVELLKESGVRSREIDIPLVGTGNGALRVVQVHASEIRDAKGLVSGLVMLLRDVSRERSMDQMKNEFISTAAHELRTPLTSILGYSELMLDPANMGRFSSEEQQDFLQEILSRAETLARIIDDLLSISRIESGQPLSLEISSADISIVIEKVVQQFQLTSKSHNYELKLLGVKGLVNVDSGRLQQVLENLLSNAVKYSDEDSLIRVTAEAGRDSYQIIIEDQGIGMLPEQQAKIFEKFYRVDYSNTKSSGLGIGMSIVKQIIDGHGGTITIVSNLGEGTRIELSLPLPR